SKRRRPVPPNLPPGSLRQAAGKRAKTSEIAAFTRISSGPGVCRLPRAKISAYSQGDNTWAAKTEVTAKKRSRKSPGTRLRPRSRATTALRKDRRLPRHPRHPRRLKHVEAGAPHLFRFAGHG